MTYFAFAAYLLSLSANRSAGQVTVHPARFHGGSISIADAFEFANFHKPGQVAAGNHILTNAATKRTYSHSSLSHDSLDHTAIHAVKVLNA